MSAQPSEYLDRRRFLASAAGATALIAAHVPFGAPAKAAADERRPAAPRIVSLELLTAAPLEAMKRFYRDALVLRVIEDMPQRLTIAGGQSRLTFVPTGAGDGKPFYHFAFNIPE